MITDIKVLDNFYTNPESISNLANDFPISGCGTGNRSIDMAQMNPQLWSGIHNALCQVHGIHPDAVDMNMFFMEHTYNSTDDIFNQTTIHIDGKNPDVCKSTVAEYKLAFCGQILMTKDVDPECAITIHKFKPHINWTEQEIVKKCIDEYTIPGELYRAGKIDLEEFKRLRKLHDDNFELTCEIKSVYNRMISWKGGTLHAQRYTKNSPRILNQYFFAEWK